MNKEPKMQIIYDADKNTKNEVLNVNRLRSLVERVETLEEEKKGIVSDIRDIFAEAKGAGYNIKIMRQIIKLRKMNTADREEQDILLDLYKSALNL